MSAYLNVQGSKDGVPVWVYQDMKSISQGIHVTASQRLQFADLTGDGKADIARIDKKSGVVDLYVNHGIADTSVAGDGIRFGDFDGDGLDDYAFVDLQGKITLFLNGGPQAQAQYGWRWVAQNGGKPITGGAGAKRQNIHLADINGDGKVDFLDVHDDGAVFCWINGGANKKAPGGWVWYPQGRIASGIGAGPGVRFADIDGDGKADLVWLSKSGSITVWLNQFTVIKGSRKLNAKWSKENGGKPVGTGVGAVREDVQLADIDGDGKADYLWVHPEDGSVSVWINQITVNPRNWVHYATKIAWGVGSSGANVLFANIDRNSRADYVVVTPKNGDIRVWTSSCGDLAPLPPSSPSSPSPHLDPTTPQNPKLPQLPLPNLPPLPPISPFGGIPKGKPPAGSSPSGTSPGGTSQGGASSDKPSGMDLGSSIGLTPSGGTSSDKPSGMDLGSSIGLTPSGGTSSDKPSGMDLGSSLGLTPSGGTPGGMSPGGTSPEGTSPGGTNSNGPGGTSTGGIFPDRPGGTDFGRPAGTSPDGTISDRPAGSSSGGVFPDRPGGTELRPPGGTSPDETSQSSGGGSGGGSGSSGGSGGGGGSHHGGLHLGGLHLPKIGFGAINALKPFASQTLDTFSSAGNAITTLAGGAGGAFGSIDVSGVADLFSSLFEGMYNFSLSLLCC